MALYNFCYLQQKLHPSTSVSVLLPFSPRFKLCRILRKQLQRFVISVFCETFRKTVVIAPFHSCEDTGLLAHHKLPTNPCTCWKLFAKAFPDAKCSLSVHSFSPCIELLKILPHVHKVSWYSDLFLVTKFWDNSYIMFSKFFPSNVAKGLKRKCLKWRQRVV